MDFMRGIVIWGGVAVAAGALGGVLAGVKNRDLLIVDRLVLRAAATRVHPPPVAPPSRRAPASAAARRG